MKLQPAYTTGSDNQQELIDTDVYLAALASNPHDIDPMLDTLRQVTANVSVTKKLTEDQKAALLNLRHDLENYLVTKEQMRVFTPESLSLQLEHQKTGGNTRHAMVLLGIVLGIVIGITALAALLIPASGEDKAQITGTIFFAMLHIGAVILFLAALPAFTRRLRAAFLWFCLGITLLGVGLLIQPIFLLFDSYDTVVAPLMESLPLFITAISAYIAARLYAQPFVPPSRATSLSSVAVIAALLCTLGVLIPHAPSATSGIVFAVVTCMLTITFVLCAMSAVLLFKASMRMSDLYRIPTRSLMIAIGVAALVCLYASIIRLAFGGPQSGIGALIQVGLVSVMGCSVLYAGYVFNKASRY